MREEDAREILCQLPDGLPWTAFAARVLVLSPGTAWCVTLRGDPIAAFGAAESGNPVLRHGWAFGTRRFRRAVPCMTRFIVETFGPDLVASGVRRVEVRAIEGHDIAHRWLTSIGARAEAGLDEYGKNGECFVQYAWLAGRFAAWTGRKRRSHVHGEYVRGRFVPSAGARGPGPR